MFRVSLLIHTLCIALGAMHSTSFADPDIRSVKPDLVVPEVTTGPPQPGARVRDSLPAYRSSNVHHLLYLPKNWQPGKRYPVLVEYAGNGPFRNEYGDLSTGRVDGSNMGYGLSGGRDFIWLCLPYISADGQSNQRQWWGDPAATVAYCIEAVNQICANWGGDPDALILMGFSRGAIACNYIGLRNDTIATLWKGFIAYSHYDGERIWPYPDSDQDSARTRLQRLQGRPTLIIHEGLGVERTRAYLESTDIHGLFTYMPLGFRNHNDAWTLRSIPARQSARAWLHALVGVPALE